MFYALGKGRNLQHDQTHKMYGSTRNNGSARIHRFLVHMYSVSKANRAALLNGILQGSPDDFTNT